MKIRSLFPLILFFGLITVSSLCRGEDTITVALSPMPMVEMMIDGEAKGVNINLMNTLFSKINLKPEYVMMSFQKCMKSLRDGDTDFIGSLQYTDERAGFLKYIHPPYMEPVIIFFLRKGEKDRLKTYEDLYQLKVGVMRGYKNFEPFDSDNQILKENANDYETNYKKLLNKKIDVLIDDYIEGPYRARSFGLTDQIEMSSYQVKLGKNGYFAISKKSKHIDRVPEIEAALKKMVENGEVDRIINTTLKAY